MTFAIHGAGQACTEPAAAYDDNLHDASCPLELIGTLSSMTSHGAF